MYQIIKKDILKFFCMYMEQGSKLAFFVFVLSFLMGCYFRKYSKVRSNRGLIFIKSIDIALLTFYIYIVIGITLLSRSENYKACINLYLLSTFFDPTIDSKYIYENVVLFIPFSILLYVLAKPFRNLKISLLIGVCFSLLIEVVQLITQFGSFILDDILTNTMGMLIGYLICELVNKTFLSYF